MKDAISTTGAPSAIGPYSQGMRTGGIGGAGGLVFLSGQIPLDPESGQLVGGDIAVQTERVLKNLRAVLAADDLDFDDVVKTTIYLVDLADFAAVNETYGRFFRAPFPARSTVQVAALPRGASIEIDAIAAAR